MNEVMLIVGYVAAILTAATPAPQIWKAIKTKSTRDISMPMIVFLLILTILWTVYGFYLKDLPLIWGDGIGAILFAVVIILKLKYD